jgi:hypothetical protein
MFGISKPAEWPGVDVPRLTAILSETLREGEPDADLEFARLCDAFRAMDVDPPPFDRWSKPKAGTPSPEAAEKLKREMEEKDRVRLRLLVASLQERNLWEVIRQRALEWGAGRVATDLFVAFAMWSDLLTPELLLKSAFRVEEFARKWVDAVGASVAGEKLADSEKRLRNLDYGKVLENLEKAQKAREEHRKRLEEIERKRAQEEYERTQRE